MFLVADFFQPLLQEHAGSLGSQRVAGAELEVVHVAAKLVQTGQRFAAQRAAQRRGKQGFEQAHAVLAGEHAQSAERLVADATFRNRHGAQKGRVIVVVDPEPKPAAQILDFSAVEETGAAGDLVRNLRLAQGFLEDLGLVIGAVQHGKVPKFQKLWPGAGAIAGAQALDARYGAFGLMLFAVSVHQPHRLAFAQIAPQVFRKQLGVEADHIIGGAQDGAGGAVVLLQLDDLEGREIKGQIFQVVQSGAAPAVDRLVVVADGGKTRAAGGFAADQVFEHLVLRDIGVLVFVHQHVAQQRLPLGSDRLVLAQQLERQADEVVKVDALVSAQALFIVRHDAGGDALGVIGGRCVCAVGIKPLIFPQADGPLPLPHGCCIGAGADVFQDAGDVVAVQNREVGFEAQRLSVLAQHAHTERVESANQHLPGDLADQALGAFTHLAGSLVGESDCGNAVRFQAGLNQASNLVRDDARLARTGAGQHQAGAVHEVDSFLLGQVQANGCVGGGR